MLHIGHTTQHGQHSFGRTGKAESPRGHAVLRALLLQARHDVIRHVGEAATQKRLHDDGWDVPFMQLAVEIFRIHVAGGGVLPIQVVQLDLHEVPRNAHVEHMIEHLHVAMEGPTKVTDASRLPLLQQEIQHTIVDITILEELDATASSDGVHQVVVQIVRLQALEGLAIHRQGVLPGVVSLVGEFGRQEIGVARMTTEGNSRGSL